MSFHSFQFIPFISYHSFHIIPFIPYHSIPMYSMLRPAATRNAQRSVPNADPQRKGPMWISSSVDGVDAFSPGRKKHPKEPICAKGSRYFKSWNLLTELLDRGWVQICEAVKSIWRGAYCWWKKSFTMEDKHDSILIWWDNGQNAFSSVPKKHPGDKHDSQIIWWDNGQNAFSSVPKKHPGDKHDSLIIWWDNGQNAFSSVPKSIRVINITP